MFNFRRSALYVAVVGAAFAAGEAGAACPAGTVSKTVLINGYATKTCVVGGSTICDSLVLPPSGPVPPPLSNKVNPTMQCSITGADTTGTFADHGYCRTGDLPEGNALCTAPPVAFLTTGKFLRAGFIVAAHEPPGQTKCKVPDNKNNGRDKKECVVNPEGNSDLSGPGGPITSLSSPPAQVRCDRNGNCAVENEILPPPGTTCDGGGQARDFTPTGPLIATLELCYDVALEGGGTFRQCDSGFYGCTPSGDPLAPFACQPIYDDPSSGASSGPTHFPNLCSL